MVDKTLPVIPILCSDPFVLKHNGIYYSYCSGIDEQGRCMPAFRSTDLIQWESLGGVMEPVDAMPPFSQPPAIYQSPAVRYENGRFYLYYSAGDGTRMQIRVAVASQPEGPFVDANRRLSQEETAIDPHLFSDKDGLCCLLYASHNPGAHRPVSVILLDHFVDPLTLAGSLNLLLSRSQAVLSAPFVLQHKGRYFLIYSTSPVNSDESQDGVFGIAYVASRRLDDLQSWQEAPEEILLQSRPDLGMVEPGHFSLVRGPDNRQPYAIYHHWNRTDRSERVMAISRFEWVGDRPVILDLENGLPVVQKPTLSGFGMDGKELALPWTVMGGRWSVQERAAEQRDSRPGELAEAHLPLPETPFLIETSLRALTVERRSPGAYGVLLDGELGELLALTLLPRTGESGTGTALLQVGWGEAREERPLNLPGDFSTGHAHLVRIEVDHLWGSLRLDEELIWQGRLGELPRRGALFSQGTAAAFDHFELTQGWEDCFEDQAGQELTGWAVEGDSFSWAVRQGALHHLGHGKTGDRLLKATGSSAYELVVNVRREEDGEIAFEPALDEAENGPRFGLVEQEGGWFLQVDDGERFALTDFDPHKYQQFRFSVTPERVQAFWLAEELGAAPGPERPVQLGFWARGAASLDQVRLTSL